MRAGRRAVLLGALALVACGRPSADPSLLSALRGGGHVIFLDEAATPASVGRGLRRNDIAVSDVRSTPAGQGVAAAAFGAPDVDATLVQPDRLRTLLSESRQGRGNLVLVGPAGAFRAVTGLSLEGGAAGIVRPRGSLGYEVVGQIGAADW